MQCTSRSSHEIAKLLLGGIGTFKYRCNAVNDTMKAQLKHCQVRLDCFCVDDDFSEIVSNKLGLIKRLALRVAVMVALMPLI